MPFLILEQVLGLEKNIIMRAKISQIDLLSGHDRGFLGVDNPTGHFNRRRRVPGRHSECLLVLLLPLCTDRHPGPPLKRTGLSRLLQEAGIQEDPLQQVSPWLA